VTSTIQAMITEAYQKLGIVSEGRPPTPTQSANALTITNDNILTQMRDGWGGLGWFPQVPANINNNAPLKDEDIGDIKLMMAAWLAPHYGVTIASSQDPSDLSSLGNQIKDANRRLNKRYLRYVECDLGELSRAQGSPFGGAGWI
jgi:hypothetical protein